MFTLSTAILFIHLTSLLFTHESIQSFRYSLQTGTLYVLQRLNTHSSRLVSNSAQSSSQIIVNKIDLSIFFPPLLVFFPSSSPVLDTSLHSLHSPFCLCPSLLILSQISLPRLPRAASITACPPTLLPPSPLMFFSQCTEAMSQFLREF